MKLIGKGSVVGLCVAGALLMTPQAASAATLGVDYDASGSSHIASTDSTIELKPTTLSVEVESADGSFTGHLPLADTTTNFNAIGLVPVSATVSFVEAAPITGNLITEGTTTRIESTASYYIKLSNVKLAGIPAYVGNHCQTKQPVSIPADTPAGETFHILRGGNLTGEYTIGDFEDCFLQTALINLIVPGSGNTAQLVASNARLS